MSRFVAILILPLFLAPFVHAEIIDDRPVYSFSAGPVHSQLDGYLGGSIWGAQLRGFISYKGLEHIDALAGFGYRIDGAEGLHIHRLTLPLLLGPRVCLGRTCFSLVSGVEGTFPIFKSRGSEFFVPPSGDIKAFEILWPSTLEASFWLNKGLRLGASMNATVGLTPTVTQRTRDFRTMILAPEISASFIF